MARSVSSLAFVALFMRLDASFATGETATLSGPEMLAKMGVGGDAVGPQDGGKICWKKDLAKTIEKCEHIHLDFEKLSPSEFGDVMRVFKLGKVITLSLRGNKISEAQGLEVAQAVKLSNVHTFRYRDNPLSPAAMDALCAAAKDHPSLTVFDVRGANLADEVEGGTKLGGLLKDNAGLATLELRGTRIGPIGAVAIASALRQNTKVQLIDIRHNPIGDEGASALAELLKTNSVLRWLFVEDDSISAEAMAALKQVKPLNPEAQVYERRRYPRRGPPGLEEEQAEGAKKDEL